MIAGALCLSLGLLFISRSASLVWMGAAMVGPVAIGALLAGGMANTTIVSRWFRRRRGRALGIATVSSGAGGFVMVQLITYWIAQHGWRGALVRVAGLLAVGITALALALVRSRPSEEQLARGTELGSANAAAAHESSWALRDLLRTRNFWCIAFGTGLLMASDGAILASKVPYLLGLGIEAQAASFVVACQTASAIVGKVVIGLLADRIELRRLFAFVALCHVCLLGVLIAEPSYPVLLVAVSIFGIGFGGVYPLLATLTASSFGSTSFGSVTGVMHLVTHPFSIAALTFIGFAHDRTGSYDLAFWGFIGVVFVSTALIAGITPNAAAVAPQGAAPSARRSSSPARSPNVPRSPRGACRPPPDRRASDTRPWPSRPTRTR
jgi:sugar phosphate permease